MGFDFLARHYRWMEWLLAGGKLQRCRTAFIRDIPPPRHVLMPGEGNGRCLIEMLRAFPAARFTCVDASAKMLACARTRVLAHGLEDAAVEFIHANALDWQPPAARFDLLVTHFFLDCFRAGQLATLVPRLAAAATPDARWLLADFREPASGLAKWRARWILRAMYFFFRRMTRLPARHLTPPDRFLQRSGFTLRERRLSDWGLLHGDLWERAPVHPSAVQNCILAANTSAAYFFTNETIPAP
jgi:ubiquinone/menaquinone biosynthesis C-methylase UbiE